MAENDAVLRNSIAGEIDKFKQIKPRLYNIAQSYNDEHKYFQNSANSLQYKSAGYIQKDKNKNQLKSAVFGG